MTEEERAHLIDWVTINSYTQFLHHSGFPERNCPPEFRCNQLRRIRKVVTELVDVGVFPGEIDRTAFLVVTSLLSRDEKDFGEEMIIKQTSDEGDFVYIPKEGKLPSDYFDGDMDREVVNGEAAFAVVPSKLNEKEAEELSIVPPKTSMLDGKERVEAKFTGGFLAVAIESRDIATGTEMIKLGGRTVKRFLGERADQDFVDKTVEMVKQRLARERYNLLAKFEMILGVLEPEDGFFPADARNVHYELIPFTGKIHIKFRLHDKEVVKAAKLEELMEKLDQGEIRRRIGKVRQETETDIAIALGKAGAAKFYQ